MTKNILVVDDDMFLRKLYYRMLAEQGYAPTLAAGTLDGKALLGSGRYDLVITDFELGDGNGEEIITAAKGTKTILVTGSLGAEQLRLLAERHGLAACFEKPFKLDELMSQVRKILG